MDDKGRLRRELEQRVRGTETQGQVMKVDGRDLKHTFSMTDSVGRHGPPNVDYATAVGHLVFIRVLTGVIIIQRVHNTQIEEKFIQDLWGRVDIQTDRQAGRLARKPLDTYSRWSELAP